MPELNKVRERLLEMEGELQTLAGEVYLMGLDYADIFERIDVLDTAYRAINQAQVAVKAAGLQLAEWNPDPGDAPGDSTLRSE